MKKPHLAYRRSCAGLITLILCVSAFTGCGGSPDGAGGKREIPAPDESTQEASQTQNPNQTNEAEGTVFQNKGTITSLYEVKKKATSAGYETADLVEIQMTMAEGIAAGFNVVIGDSQNPVLEFETAEKAQAYAEYVNASGTGSVIVNGCFFTYLEDRKDGSIDEDALLVLEGFLDASSLLRVTTDIPKSTNVPTNTSEYKDAYALMTQINTAMSTLLSRALEEQNKNHPWGDPQNTGEVMPLLFNSIDLCFTAYFCENEAAYAGIVAAAEMVGITETKMTRNGAHDYILSGKTFSDKAFEIHGVYDPATKGFRMLVNTEGTITEFFEFIPLGDGQYAFQADQERALAVYQNGKLTSFVYTRIGSTGYDNETDSIFPAGTAAGMNWAAGPGEGVCDEYYAFDGQTVKLNVQTFGGRIIAEIPSSAKAQ